MSGDDFEEYCTKLLSMTGMFEGGTIHRTKYAGDYGVDIVIECNDTTRVAVQCKCYKKNNIDQKAIREVYAGMSKYYASKAAVITNRDFTPGVKELAMYNGVTLIDRDKLLRIINIYNEHMNKLLNSNQWDDFVQ